MEMEILAQPVGIRFIEHTYYGSAPRPQAVEGLH